MLPVTTSSTHPVTHLAFSPDGSTFAAAQPNFGVTLHALNASLSMDRAKEAFDDLKDLYARGELKLPQVFFDGLDSAPQAFIALMSGSATGKIIVRLAEA